MISAGPFVPGLKCSGNVFGMGFLFSWQRGTLQLIVIHLITIHNTHSSTAIIKTEAENQYLCHSEKKKKEKNGSRVLQPGQNWIVPPVSGVRL